MFTCLLQVVKLLRSSSELRSPHRSGLVRGLASLKPSPGSDFLSMCVSCPEAKPKTVKDGDKVRAEFGAVNQQSSGNKIQFYPMISRMTESMISY